MFGDFRYAEVHTGAKIHFKKDIDEVGLNYITLKTKESV